MAKTRAAGGVPAEAADPGVREETIEAGEAALHVTGLGEAAVALGEAVATKGPPAAGEGQLAERVADAAIETTRLEDTAGIERTDHVGDRLGTFSRAAAPGPFEELGYQRLPETVVVARRSGRDDVLPLAGPTIDPETVPGRRIATAAVQVRRGGRTYLPGERFPIDYRAHAELVPIGAIEATSWERLPDADED